MACPLQGLTGRAAETLTCSSGQGKPLPAATLRAQPGCTSRALFQKEETEEHVGAGLDMLAQCQKAALGVFNSGVTAMFYPVMNITLCISVTCCVESDYQEFILTHLC